MAYCLRSFDEVLCRQTLLGVGRGRLRLLRWLQLTLIFVVGETLRLRSPMLNEYGHFAMGRHSPWCRLQKHFFGPVMRQVRRGAVVTLVTDLGSTR